MAEEPGGTPGVALLAMDDSARVWVELFLGRHELEGFVLLDRSAGEALMEERNLLLNARRPDAGGFDLQRWVSADILVVIESFLDAEGEARLLWVRALDAVTGVRLADEILEVQPEKHEEVLKAVDGVLREKIQPSWSVLWGEGKTFAGVALLDIRLVGAGEQDRYVFSSLSMLLQRLIVRNPEVVLLERTQLESLLNEEALSPALRMNLQSSLVLIEGGIHQEAEGAFFTLKGMTPTNKRIFEETFSLREGVMPVDIATRALELLAKHLPDITPDVSRDLRGEARRFHRVAGYYLERRDYERAREAATAAYALNPGDRENMLMLYDASYMRALHDVSEMKGPEFRELDDLLRDIRNFFQYLPTIDRISGRNRTSGQALVRTVDERFGNLISADARLMILWRDIGLILRRSLDGVRPEQGVPVDIFTPEHLDLFIQTHLSMYRPLSVHDLRLFFGTNPDGTEYRKDERFRQPILDLIQLMENRPYIRIKRAGSDRAQQYNALDDLYARHLTLSVLNFLASHFDEARKKQTVNHLRQCAWLLVEDPLRWSVGTYADFRRFPVEFRETIVEVYKEIREEIEGKGWLVPELYAMDSHDQFPRLAEKANDPGIRLVSNSVEPGAYSSYKEKLIARFLHLPIRPHSRQVWMERMRANGPSIDDKEIRVIRPRGPRPPGGYIRKPLHNYEHFKIWNDNFIAHVDLYPEETYAREALEVYEKSDEEIRLVKTVRFPHDGVENDIDVLNEKSFYQVLLGGRNHLYYSHRHSLYQFDEEMNMIRRMDLRDWNFPDHMVANLLEIPGGILVVLTKRFLYQTRDSEGRIMRWELRNNGGVVVLADENLEILEVLANIDRPSPENDLDRFGPFDGHAMYEDSEGNIILGVAPADSDQPPWFALSWFEIGEDRVPRRRQPPEEKESISVWASKLGLDPEEPLFKHIVNFCVGNIRTGAMRVAYLPGSRPSRSREFRRIVPFGEGFLVLTFSEKQVLSLFYLTDQHRIDEGYLVRSFPKEHFNAISLWGEDVVLRGYIHQNDRLIRKEALEALILGGNRDRPFPDAEHLKDQTAFQKRIRDNIFPHIPPPVSFPDPEPLDHFVPVTGATFPLHPLGGNQNEKTSITLSAFKMSETMVTQEEFFRVYKWAVHNGYRFSINFPGALETRSWCDSQVNIPERPVFWINPLNALLYCNARSEWEGLKPAYYLDKEHREILRRAEGDYLWGKRHSEAYVDWNAGYRLPTAAEWEYVARGADPEHDTRYPWGDTISHDLANYLASDFFTYDLSDGGLHPVYAGNNPPIAPVKAFPPHGFENRFYGLVGNVSELVWERREDFQYNAEGIRRRRNPVQSRGGNWASLAENLCIQAPPSSRWDTFIYQGFRVVLPEE
ncbi:MAG: formylglycine-generating enzyme family protein [Kiritimatiellae bacterium]|nr:formylglycine-generating enzyme family protein [Kiritimatiellia bacterium]